MTSLLKWWLISCLTMLGIGVSVYFDIHTHLYNSDITRLSYLILFIFVCTTIWIGNKTYRVYALEDYEQRADVGWFISEACLAIGMVGTVTGFLLMLGTAFKDLDVTNVVSLQDALANMALGMSTALYTTLIGLICSLLIKVQLVNFEVSLRE